ncbi:unnamed protein product [Microthlaspi erraticum]|uniref:Reverse transcriptase zinc-binding domain-containing protein n=1 Tax=Microthlaspi erraticum TaxID=1685480 RepID=A0A6D2HC85_9BRAS|nr:unnamed protein product [Microthlaspi erraticum]CAA7013971.1 unnamed protein product [Microthlaspi erraticum]CAA7037001.1 unnamed protein product [Microthlaspi erraticum]
MQPQEQISWNFDIWNGNFSPKMKVFMWKIVQKALPLGDNLLSRGIPDNACCVQCGELETAEHLFLHCPFAQRVWELLPLKTHIIPSLLTSFTNTLATSKAMICLPPTGISQGPIFPWLIWSIWTVRNYLIFEERTFAPESTILKALTEARDWQNAQYAIEPTKPRLRKQKPHAIGEYDVTCNRRIRCDVLHRRCLEYRFRDRQIRMDLPRQLRHRDRRRTISRKICIVLPHGRSNLDQICSQQCTRERIHPSDSQIRRSGPRPSPNTTGACQRDLRSSFRH